MKRFLSVLFISIFYFQTVLALPECNFFKSKNCFGELELEGGEKYIGDIGNNKKPHGQGTYTWPDGTIYIGQFKNGLSDGHGKITWSDGNKYVGEFLKNERHGQGTYTWANGGKYIGEYKNGQKDGAGTLILPGIYSGLGIGYEKLKKDEDFLKVLDVPTDYPAAKSGLVKGDKIYKINNIEVKNKSHFEIANLFTGPKESTSKIIVKRKDKEILLEIERKIIKFEDQKYVGQFKNGYKNGYGVYTSAIFSYEGEWVDDKKHGNGILIFNRNTEKFIGNFINDHPGGPGTLIDITQDQTYVGNFDKNLRLVGEGKILKDGKSYKVILGPDGKYKGL